MVCELSNPAKDPGAYPWNKDREGSSSYRFHWRTTYQRIRHSLGFGSSTRAVAILNEDESRKRWGLPGIRRKQEGSLRALCPSQMRMDAKASELGADFYSCQLVQQPAALLKAYQGCRARGHAQHSRRQRGQFQTQGPDRAGRIRSGIAHRDSKRAVAAEVPVRFGRSSGDGYGRGRSLRRGKAALVPQDRRYRRSGVVPARGRPSAMPAAAPPSPPPRSPSQRPTGSLRAFRFPGRFRCGGRFEAPFFGLPGGGRWGTLQLAVRPVLTAFPIGFQFGAKRVSGLNLLTGNRGLLRSQEARMGLAPHGAGEAVVRTMACVGVLGAGTPRLAALDGALR